MNELLNKPYPLEISWQKNFRISLFSGLFICFFLYFFQLGNILFGIERMDFWMTLVYGFITFATMIGFLYFLPKYLPKIFNEDYWTVKKELIHLLLLVLFIALFNYLSTLILFGFFAGSFVQLNYLILIESFITIFGSTFIIAFFPLSAHVFYRQNIYLKRYLEETELINASLHKNNIKNSIVVEGVGKNESISFQLEDLFFIKSQGNYCEFFFGDKNKNEVIRNSLADVQNQIESTKIYKCHRSYLVHLGNIEKVSGNAQGLRLHFKNREESVPVSRNLSSELRALLYKD